MRRLTARFAGFSGVGVVVTLFSVALLWMLTDMSGMDVAVAYVLSYAVSIQLSFFLNMKMVFRRPLSWRNWAAFNATYLAGMALGVAVIELLKGLLPAGVDPAWAGYMAVPVTVMFNFIFVNYKMNKYLLFAIGVYVLARGAMLFVGGVWWDDWLIWNAPRETLVNTWITEGNTPHLAAIHLFIRDHFAVRVVPYVYRVVAFLCGLINVILAWAILGHVGFSRGQRSVIVSIFAAAPFNMACMTLCCVMYTVSTLLFYVGAWLFTQGVYKGCRVAAVIAPFVLFLSLFYWMSPIVIIPFMLLVVALDRVRPEGWTVAGVKAVVVRALKWWWIWVVPIIFWVVRSLFFAPKAQFAEYYAINMKSVVALPAVVAQSLVKNVVGFFGYIFGMATGGLMPTIVLLILVAAVLWLFFRVMRREDAAGRGMREVFWCGVILFAGAVIPTTLIGGVGDVSSFEDINSRYQVLMGLPVALIVFAAGQLIGNERARRWFFGAVIALSMFATIRTVIQYQKGWFKELAVAEIIANEPRLGVSGVNVVVRDMALQLNEYPAKNMPDYAWTGISNLALDRDQTHRYISATPYAKAVAYNPAVDNYVIAGAEKCPDPTKFHYILIIDAADENTLSMVSTVKLTLRQIVSPEAFREELKGLFKYTLMPIDENTSVDEIIP